MKKTLYRIILKCLLKLYDFVYQKLSAAAIRYYGMHPKHKFEDFHRFFLENIPEGAKVLDVGCSRGELTVELSCKASKVAGYDISKESIKIAKKNNVRKNICYFVGEATQDMPKEQFGVAVCSNVLEHLSAPQDFLRKLYTVAEKVLIRVPNAESNWIIGVKKDLGIDYFLDPQHCKEYTPASIREELENAFWQVESMQISHELKVIAKRKNQI